MFGPPLVLYAVFCVGGIIVAVAYLIWGAIRGHSGDGPLHPVTRLVLGLIGLGLLYELIAPWL